MGWLKRLLGFERKSDATRVPRPPARRPPAPTTSLKPIPGPGSPASPPPRRSRARDPWCDFCDMCRDWCEHGHRDRQAGDIVFATRLGSTYHLRVDCNALTVPRAKSLDAGQGNSRMRRISRGTARQDGLEPCRICMGTTPSRRA